MGFSKASDERALKHGGSAAKAAVSSGKEFTGPAKDAELAVRDELATDGRVSIVERAAVRLQAASDLYWNALIDAGSRGDTKAVNSYSKTFGWLQSKALSAWLQLGQEREKADDMLVIDAIEDLNGNNSTD